MEGTVVKILKKESGISKSGKEWKKAGFVIKTNGDYPKEVFFSLFGEKIETLLPMIEIGKKVDVEYNLSSREWNGRWFTDASAWSLKIEKDDKTENNEHPF